MPTGIPTHQTHHTLRVAKFALQAIAAAKDTLLDADDASYGAVKVRVGMHVGQVVGVLIGAMRPKYTLLGDTMNIGAGPRALPRPHVIACRPISASVTAHACSSTLRGIAEAERALL